MSRFLPTALTIPSGFFLIALALPARADVLVVRGPGSTHATLQSAVDAALDGDVLLVRAGTDPSVVIHGKSLSIAVEPNAQALVDGSLTVEHLLDGQSVVISGLRIIPSTPQPSALLIQHCAGSVRVNGCTVQGSTADSLQWPPWSGIGVHVTNSLDVALAHTSILGGYGGFVDCYGPAQGGSGAECYGSRVAISSCTVQGGGGGDVYTEEASGHHCYTAGERGGDGLRVQGGVLFAGGTQIRGGGGGMGGDGGYFPGEEGGVGGNGGHGIVMSGIHLTVLLDNLLAGGPGGSGGWPLNIPGTPGSPMVGAGAIQLAGAARLAKVTPLARENQALTATFEGVPGDRVWLIGSDAPRFFLELSHNGVSLARMAPFPAVVPIGTIPASGILQVQRGVNQLSAGTEGRVTHTQAIFIDVQGVPWLADAQPVVVVDSSF